MPGPAVCVVNDPIGRSEGRVCTAAPRAQAMSAAGQRRRRPSHGTRPTGDHRGAAASLGSRIGGPLSDQGDRGGCVQWQRTLVPEQDGPGSAREQRASAWASRPARRRIAGPHRHRGADPCGQPEDPRDLPVDRRFGHLPSRTLRRSASPHAPCGPWHGEVLIACGRSRSNARPSSR